MKVKPNRRKKQKARQIEHLLPHFEQILISLEYGDSNVNGVYGKLKQTGFTNKKDVIDAIEILKKGQLISKKRHPESRLKMIVSLTDLGKNVAHLISSIKSYIEAWSSLEKTMANKFNPPELESALQSTGSLQGLRSVSNVVLKHRGWSREEIESFDYYEHQPSFGLTHLLEQSPSIVINMLLIKYSVFLEMQLNQFALSLLLKILIDLIAKVVETFRVRRQEGDTRILALTDKNCGLVMDHINLVLLNGGFVYRFINQDVVGTLDSMFSIAEPKKEFVKNIAIRIDSIRAAADEIEREYQRTPNTMDAVKVNEYISSRRIIPYLQKLIERLNS